MYIYKFNYREYPQNKIYNPWNISDLCLRDFNLIVGKNTTGKTRVIRLLKNLAAIIKAQKVSLHEAEWEIEFKQAFSDENVYMKFNLEIHNKEVVREELWVEGKLRLQRDKSETKLYPENKNTDDSISISPPNNRLVLHVRRDKAEFPYFESLVHWAETLNDFTFATSPNNITVLLDDQSMDSDLPGLEVAPSLLEKLNNTRKIQIIDELNEVGYAINSLETIRNSLGMPLIQLKEDGIKHAFSQFAASQGMFRAVSLLIMIAYFQQKSKNGVILVDDLCEGLDYARSTKLTKLLLKKIKKSKMQFIATTNDDFLMNEVPFKYWNILKRTLGKVKAFNYKNSKKIFDEMELTGFSNFNIFSSNLIDKLK